MLLLFRFLVESVLVATYPCEAEELVSLGGKTL